MEILNNNDLYNRYGNFVNIIVKKTKREFFWELDDGEAEQIAWTAVLESYPKFTGFNDRGEPVKFESYIQMRIRGSIIDEIRKRTCYRSNIDGKRVFVNKTMPRLEDMSTVEYEELTSFHIAPEELIKPSFEDMIASIKDERERSILYLLYIHELTVREISIIHGITTSRISQIHTKILKQLKHHKEIYNAWD